MFIAGVEQENLRIDDNTCFMKEFSIMEMVWLNVNGLDNLLSGNLSKICKSTHSSISK